MNNKRILVIQGHPNKESYIAALANRYFESAKENNFEIELIHLIDLEFDLVLRMGYRSDQSLEPDLIMMQEKIKACDHLIIFYPMWWASMPALLKGFIDRTLMPGFAFEYSGRLPVKLLKGRSARFVMTMDSPRWYYNILIGAPGFKMMKRAILNFCGFSPVKKTVFYNVRGSSIERRKNWLKKIGTLGAKGV